MVVALSQGGKHGNSSLRQTCSTPQRIIVHNVVDSRRSERQWSGGFFDLSCLYGRAKKNDRPWLFYHRLWVAELRYIPLVWSDRNRYIILDTNGERPTFRYLFREIRGHKQVCLVVRNRHESVFGRSGRRKWGELYCRQSCVWLYTENYPGIPVCAKYPNIFVYLTMCTGRLGWRFSLGWKVFSRFSWYYVPNQEWL